MDITPYLQLMVKKDASDLFVTTSSPIRMKVDGKMMAVGENVLSAEICEAIAKHLLGEDRWRSFTEAKERDLAISLPGGGDRFRVNIFQQRGHVSLVLRKIPSKIPTLEDLKLPSILEDMVMQKRGLIIMSGATGSGKSTSLAAMINHRNTNSPGHILTIEDPIEFSHPNQKSIINQREIGIDTASYQAALRSSLREAPDVILVGESRDRETVEAVLSLCNTGHLVLTTLHANNTDQSIERIINFFPKDMHSQLFMDLSLNLRAVISQRLVASTTGKRCAAIEIMLNTPHISDLILTGQIHKIKPAMEESRSQGTQTFDQALLHLYKDGRVPLEEALASADSRVNLEAKINFG